MGLGESCPITPYEEAVYKLQARVRFKKKDKKDRLLRLNPLRELYFGIKFQKIRNYAPDTLDGIIAVLDAIESTQDFDCFLRMQNSLVQHIGSSVIPIGCKYVTFFSFAAMYAYAYTNNHSKLMKLLYRLDNCMEAFDHVPAAMAILLERLLALGEDGSSPLVDSDHSVELLWMCHALTTRVKNYSKYVTETKPKLQSILTEGFQLEPTTGDLHMGSRAPLKITKRNGEIWYYKPRSLEPELIFNKAIHLFNRLAEDSSLGLPSLKIEDFVSPSNISLEACVEPARNMPVDMALNYAKSLGALLCLAKLMGLTDLHYDNIVATVAGPCVIDVECLFQRSVITSHELEITELGMLFSEQALNKSCDFKVEGLSFVKCFQTNQSFFDKPVNEYRSFFDELVVGYQAACNICQHHTKKFLDIYMQALNAPNFLPRIVPCATGQFIAMIKSFLLCSASDTRPLVIEDATKEILESLKNDGYYTPEDQKFLDRNRLTERLFYDFRNATIPIFNVHTGINGQLGYLSIDGVPFLRFSPVSLESLQGEFMENASKLNMYEFSFLRH